MTMGLAEAQPSVLVVEDDDALRSFLHGNLTADRFSVEATKSAEEALVALRNSRPDAALLDLSLPGMSGLELLAAIRAGGADEPWDPGMPVLIVTAATEANDAVRGLRRGADDYIGKPFHYPELHARLAVAMRRARGAGMRDELRVGALVIDRHARRATLHGRVLNLSNKELALLVALARDPRRVLSKAELLRDVWGYRGPARTRTVDSHASRLRRKLATAGAEPGYVANVWGVGYRLLPHDA